MFTSGVVATCAGAQAALFFIGRHAGENLSDVLKHRVTELDAPSEEVYYEKYETHEHAVRAANDYIERFYNPKRLHSALDYVSPPIFELDLEITKTNFPT